MPAKTWFITGASKGFGRERTEAALDRGDRVAALSRSPGVFDELVHRYGDAVLPPRVEVTDRAAVAVRRAVERSGSLDVVVNNAGYGLFGMVEEVSEQQARDRSGEYDGVRAGTARPAGRRGDPAATRPAILRIVDADDPPLRVFRAQGPLQVIKKEYAARIEEWERWDDLAVSAFGT